ncbi:MAG TPA: BON domain-containing protein [Gemmataceae bacterium]|nr:BON domain-containing protein [Gemmataceae bacterium]
MSPSPFGYTSRLATSGFQNTGFRNSGFQNTGFRNSGFQNTGFRNGAYSNSGFGTGQSYNANYYPPGAPAMPGGQPTDLTNANNYNFNGAQPNPNGVGVYQQNPGYAQDNSATIMVGPGTNLNSGYSMPTISHGARFTLGLGFDSPVGTTNPRLSEELQRQFTNSQRFGSGKTINVSVENNVVVLRGTVADDHDRDLAEAMIRLSPGVYNVRNELQLSGNVASANR